MKHIKLFSGIAVFSLIFSISSFAGKYDYFNANIQEIHGNATLLTKDDYLLDGNYDNGELVNGDICFSEEEALAVIHADAFNAVQPDACEESSPIDNRGKMSILENIPTEYSDVYDIGIPKKNGNSSITRISLDNFRNITPRELSEYLDNCISCPHHDWHALVIDSKTAVFYAYTLEHPVYGVWDENKGITQILGDYLSSPDNHSYELVLR